MRSIDTSLPIRAPPFRMPVHWGCCYDPLSSRENQSTANRRQCMGSPAGCSASVPRRCSTWATSGSGARSTDCSMRIEAPVPLELSQIVAELVEAVGFIGEVEGRQDGVVDFLRGPTADLGATVQQDFEKADDTRVVDLDAGISDGADGDRQGNPLQDWKVDMDVEPLRLEASEAADDGLEL